MGLPPVADPLGADATSNRLALYALSAHVFRRPRRWPAHHHLTGFLFLDEDTRIDPALERFVAAGEPPVVITFGSMVHADADQTTALLVDAVLRSGRRAVLQRGWSGLGRGALPDVIHSTDFVPHGWLFPRASCVVHAGGAGTTAATLRAGIPTVVVPHWLDQPIWAELARELGCAGAVLPVRALEAEALARAISDTLGSQRCADKARELSAKIAAEDGTAVACTLLEELVRSG
jgi:UDP:flavonoid glycosyltransferase YjiC (YdhE family)